MSELSFEPARLVLLGLVLRSKLNLSGLRVLMGWIYCQSGALFVSMGLVLDAIFGDGPGRWALIGWGLYAVTAGFCFVHTRGPTIIAGTPYFTKRKFDHGMLIGHGLCTLAVLFYATSFWLIIAVEISWISFWVLCLFGIMLWTKQPISFGHWFMGNWASCNERDMILDIVRTWAWWDDLLDADKLMLWTAIPDWKWDLYGYCLSQKEYLVAERIAEWMQLEPNAYWHMASSMHANDVPMTIRVFLQARDRVDKPEVYGIPL